MPLLLSNIEYCCNSKINLDIDESSRISISLSYINYLDNEISFNEFIIAMIIAIQEKKIMMELHFTLL